MGLADKMYRRLLDRQLKTRWDCVRYYRKLNLTAHFGLLKERLEICIKTAVQKNMKNNNKKLYFLPIT